MTVMTPKNVPPLPFSDPPDGEEPYDPDLVSLRQGGLMPEALRMVYVPQRGWCWFPYSTREMLHVVDHEGNWRCFTAEACNAALYGAPPNPDQPPGGQIAPLPTPAPSATKSRTSGVDIEPLLDARGIESLTGVAASWWLAAARRNAIPHYKIGRYIRFRLSEIIAFAPVRGRRRKIGHAHCASATRPPSRGKRRAATKLPQR